jgi:diguanylate cyclase (GGDEF)-like protein
MKTTDELTKTKEKADQMDALAHRDSLTGVGSKLAYDQKVKQLSEDIAKGQAEFGIVMMDLNYLKQLNDNYGHERGNEAIQKTCGIICDVFKHSPVYRIGGDEFVVIVQDRDYENIEALVEQFNRKVNATEGKPWEKISAAIGYARYDNDDNVEDVFRRADKEMYDRKKEMKAAMR